MLLDHDGYETIRSLGSRGPFDLEVAWPGKSSSVERTVLLKRLRHGWQVHPDNIKAFVDDSRTLLGVAHPNLLEVIDAGLKDGRFFLVNEYLHGVTLFSLLHRLTTIDRGLSPVLVLEVVRQIAGGLSKAAAVGGGDGHGLVHGVLSEEFVLLDFNGSVKVADFGAYLLYKTVPALETLDAESLSPEQRAGSAPSGRSDLYALGCLARKMLALATPDDSSQSILAGLEQLAARLLEADPRKRPAGAKPVFEYLSRLGTSSGIDKKSALVGAFLRELFGGPSDRREQGAPAAKSHSPDDIDLLDPGQFWSSAGQSPTDTELPEPSEPPKPIEDDEQTAEVVSPKPFEIPVPAVPARPSTVPRPAVFPKAPAGSRPSIPAPGGRVAAPISFRSQRSMATKQRRTYWLLIGLAALSLAAVLAWQILARGPSGNSDAQVIEPKEALGKPRSFVKTGAHPSSQKTQAAGQRPIADGSGSLRIISEPAGVAVFINGEKHGATPARVPDLPLDTALAVSLEADGYRTWSQTLTLDKRNPSREIHAGLLKEKKCDNGQGWIYISSKPPGALVEIDGKRQPGKTPMIIDNICAGELHQLRLRLAGYNTWRKDVTVESGRVQNLAIDLQK